MKAYVLTFDVDTRDPSTQATLQVRVLYFGSASAVAKIDVMVLLANTDTPVQIRTKILDAIVANALSRGYTGFAKADVILPTYGIGS